MTSVNILEFFCHISLKMCNRHLIPEINIRVRNKYFKFRANEIISLMNLIKFKKKMCKIWLRIFACSSFRFILRQIYYLKDCIVNLL